MGPKPTMMDPYTTGLLTPAGARSFLNSTSMREAAGLSRDGFDATLCVAADWSLSSSSCY